MARTKQTAKRVGKALITWTRFHLPREQEWSTWSVDHADVHIGPLAGVEGWRKASLGKMIENSERAAYVIGECHLHRKWIAYLYILIVLYRKTT